MRYLHAWASLACLAGAALLLGGLVPTQSQEQTKEKPAKKARVDHLALFANAKPDDYIGEKECVACHPEPVKSFNKSPHSSFVRDSHLPVGKQSCEGCHGPGKAHVEHLDDPDQIPDYIFSYTKTSAKEQSQACLRCHSDTMTVAHWRRTEHARANVGCVSCHSIHHPAGVEERVTGPGAVAPTPISAAGSVRQAIYAATPDPKYLLKADEATLCGGCHHREIAEFRQNFHHPVPEGRMVCSDCHTPHPNSDAIKRIRPGRSMCVTCHAENAGPFVYEHDPAAGWTGEGCVECHRPHGSPNPRLLKLFSRGLCIQCHTDKAINHNPGITCWLAPCHVAPHGSNTDPTLRQR